MVFEVKYFKYTLFRVDPKSRTRDQVLNDAVLKDAFLNDAVLDDAVLNDGLERRTNGFQRR